VAITFKYGGATFTADTPQEAADTLALLKERDNEFEVFMKEKISRARGYMKDFHAHLSAYDESQFVWSGDLFLTFINRLGETQKLVLALLVTRRNVTDETLRSALGVPNNQALAGILSGISKQAAALLIPPRAIFDFENSRVGGKRRSEYLVVDEFRTIAAKMNWPPSTLFPQSNPA
jgi:hypothetical protein